MPARSAYRRLRELIMEEVSPGVNRDGSLADVLMENHLDELIDLGLAPPREGLMRDWMYEVEVFRVLKPKVRRQLENLVGERRLRKMYSEETHGRRNWKHRIALYYRVRDGALEAPMGVAERGC